MCIFPPWHQARLGEAEELKQEGNDLFRRGKWSEALERYRNGLALLPKRDSPPPATDEEDNSRPPEGEATGGASTETASQNEPIVDLSRAHECAKARSVLHANIAACHVKLGENGDAVKACTEALQDDPSYAKALQRRAQCNEKIGSWSALSSAKEDYNTLITLLPPSSEQVVEVKRSLRLLEPRIEATQKQEVGEMVDKLKGLGNSILGKWDSAKQKEIAKPSNPGRFGMSTDNFKFEPNGQGGYSLNFSR
ncbi:TPR-like protein [Russula earlei]|uniref:TPR-like protein n=1 Tax=Russula earlei TaxID=71964 RepID=A0ACC0U052_9AGAM|nr:TPR-like protein [Russula earlei]